MNPVKKWHCQTIAKKMVEVLKKKNFNAIYAEDLEAAKQTVLDMIPKNSSIAVGGSVTIQEMGLLDIFKTPKYNFFDRYQPLPFEEIVEIYRQGMLADYLVTSTNAITRDGELVNTDCSGNRVAGMIFGPKKVIIIAGVNKVVGNIDDALKRIKKIAPLNAKRINHKTPCTVTGECEDCDVQARICNYTSIIHNGMKFKDRISIIMVAEEAGF